MEEPLFRCRHCKKIRRKRTHDQQYCGNNECQRARKNSWRREKYATDPDYRVNQKTSTNAWLESQGGSANYHREYRKRRDNLRPESRKPLKRSSDANSDAKSAQSPVKSGRYKLLPCEPANSDAILVELSVIPTP